MRNFFIKEEQDAEVVFSPYRMSILLAVMRKRIGNRDVIRYDPEDSTQFSNRKMRRAGVAYPRLPAARPVRHTVCGVCDARTFTSAAGTCRACFLDGAGPVDEVAFG